MKKFVKIALTTFIVCALLLSIVGCGTPDVDATSITLDKTTLVVEVDDTATITATVLPSDVTDSTVTWTSSDTTVATVTDGVVVAVGVGNATITATTHNGLTATCNVSVVIDATGITLDKTALDMQVDDTATITASVLPSDVTDSTVTWTSSDTTVATVTDGVVVAVGVGSATITASTHNDYTATCSVTVTPKLPYKRVGDYVYFGTYPQTVKADSVTVSSTPNANGYYLGSDGAEYMKVVSNVYVYGIDKYDFSTGDKIINGATYYFKMEPIKWRVLKEESGKAFLLCENILTNHVYDLSADSRPDDLKGLNKYDESDMRAWLNGEFYNSAFSQLQQAIICTTTVDNSQATTGWTGTHYYLCDDTQDKVFLPSYADVTNTEYGFTSTKVASDTRCKVVSDYARATGTYMYAVTQTNWGKGTWFLRSPHGNNLYRIYVVNRDGLVDYDSVYFSDRGIAPALWITL